MGKPVSSGAPVTVERRLAWLDEDEPAGHHPNSDAAEAARDPQAAGYRRDLAAAEAAGERAPAGYQRDTIRLDRDRNTAEYHFAGGRVEAGRDGDPDDEDPPTGRPYSDQPFEGAQLLPVEPPTPGPPQPPYWPGAQREVGYGAARFGEESGPQAPVPPARRPVIGPPKGPRRKVRGWVIVLILVVVLALAVATLLVAVLDAGDKGQTGPGNSVGGQAGSDHTISAPVGDRREADFDLVTGTTAVTVHTTDLGGDLYRVSTPEDSGSIPKVVNQGSTVKLFLSSTGRVGPAAVDIQLNSRVLWRLRLTGGAAELNVDMTNGRAGSIDLVGGATRIELTLPPPAGTIPIRMTGGANQFVVHAPTNVPVRVRIGSGASNVTLDGVTHTGIAAGAVFAPDNWDQTQDRYDIDATAGVATLTLSRP